MSPNAYRAPFLSVRLRSLLAAFFLATSLGAAGCSTGDNCDECSSDDDCNDGKTCATFEDGVGNTYQMCADDDTDSCSVSY